MCAGVRLSAMLGRIRLMELEATCVVVIRESGRPFEANAITSPLKCFSPHLVECAKERGYFASLVRTKKIVEEATLDVHKVSPRIANRSDVTEGRTKPLLPAC